MDELRATKHPSTDDAVGTRQTRDPG
jgi:hypothetical protein